AMLAILLSEYANEPVDVARVVKMVLIHDIVEIEAGDKNFFHVGAELGKAGPETLTADPLFCIISPQPSGEHRQLWEEFEAAETPEARFALALDRFMPQLHNYHTKGRSWVEHGITADRVLERNASMAEGSYKLWECARALVNDAVAKGFLAGKKEK